MPNPYPKMAILQLTPSMLREILQLPEEAQIIDVRVPMDRNGFLEIKISGAGWLVSEYETIPKTTIKITKFDFIGEKQVMLGIDWGFPTD